jgi:prefoldin subunit 4
VRVYWTAIVAYALHGLKARFFVVPTKKLSIFFFLLIKKSFRMSSVKVTWEDQERINTYGRLTNRRREIEAELLALDETIKTLEDASSEITLSEEGLMYRMADCFVEMEGDEAEKLLEEKQVETRAAQKKLMVENDAAKAKLAELKVELVRHFGDAIALDKN